MRVRCSVSSSLARCALFREALARRPRLASLARFHALSLIAVSGCMHPGPPPQTASCPPSAPPAAPALATTPASTSTKAEPLPTPARELAWRLRVSDAAGWTQVPATLHTFSLPHWECALGEALRDAPPPNRQGQATRTRKLACTHDSGITVQTRLDCPIEDTAPLPVRELELSLDTSPALHVACEAKSVEQSARAQVVAP